MECSCVIFPATAVIVQPVTGYLLARLLGYPVFDGWIALSLILYALTGAFWIPRLGILWLMTSRPIFSFF